MHSIDAHICDLCIEQANGIILQENNSNENNSNEKSDLELLKPITNQAFLDDYIVGQDYTKVLVSVYNHYKRISQETENEVESREK